MTGFVRNVSLHWREEREEICLKWSLIFLFSCLTIEGRMFEKSRKEREEREDIAEKEEKEEKKH